MILWMTIKFQKRVAQRTLKDFGDIKADQQKKETACAAIKYSILWASIIAFAIHAVLLITIKFLE